LLRSLLLFLPPQEKTGMGGREVLVSEEDIMRILCFLENTSFPSPNYYIVRTRTFPRDKLISSV